MRYAARHGTGALCFAGLAMLLHPLSGAMLALAVLSTVGHVVAGWAHRDYLRGAWFGLGLGAVQLAAAGFMLHIGMRWVPAWCDEICFGIVGIGSLVVGATFAQDSARRSSAALVRGVVAFGAMGAVVVGMGCLPGNTALLFGSLVGVVLGFGPGWVVVRTASGAAAG
ncbi:MAG: hypothetical protein AAGJ56_01590 [Myxococcota bacterium]